MRLDELNTHESHESNPTESHQDTTTQSPPLIFHVDVPPPGSSTNFLSAQAEAATLEGSIASTSQGVPPPGSSTNLLSPQVEAATLEGTIASISKAN